MSSGVRLGSNSRERSIQVASLSDFALEEIKDKRLKARLHRESYDSNRFNVTFTVPQSTKEAFRTEVVLKGTQPGGPRVLLPVSFDPKDVSVPARSWISSPSRSDDGRRQSSRGQQSQTTGAGADGQAESGSWHSSGSLWSKPGQDSQRTSGRLFSWLLVCALVGLVASVFLEQYSIVSKLH